MRVVNASAEIVKGYEDDVLGKIELCGRVCYKSEDKITNDSKIKFCQGLIKRGHTSVLEHGVYIMEVSKDLFTDAITKNEAYHAVTGDFRLINMTMDRDRYIISGNVTALRYQLNNAKYQPEFMIFFIHQLPAEERILFNDLLTLENEDAIKESPMRFCRIISRDELSSQEELSAHTYTTVRFIVNRGITHEIVRHRKMFSPSQESSRYCCYANDKFGNEITYINPFFFDPNLTKDVEEIPTLMKKMKVWTKACKKAEKYYFKLLKLGAKAEEARDVLPTALKSELIVTANDYAWQHFFDMRTDKAAHPAMREVARPLLQEFIDEGIGFEEAYAMIKDTYRTRDLR